MKSITLALGVLLAVSNPRAQADAWQPSPGHAQVPIWPGSAPHSQPAPGPEDMIVRDDALVAGRPWSAVVNVSQPTLTVYSPKGKSTGAAVIVFPGGGYKCLAIDLEGTEVCEWLTSRGVTALLLKYRVPFSGHYWDGQLRNYVTPTVPAALQDAQRAISLARFRFTEWNIDPHKIGVIGFSAGGHMAAEVSTRSDQRSYPAVDAADRESCRPDFAMVLYPGHLWNWTALENPPFELNPDIAAHITSQTPPTFLLQAENDPVDDVNNSLVYYVGLRKAGVPVEMHLYAEGGHAFGTRRTRYPISEWPQLAEKWLRTIGVIAE